MNSRRRFLTGAALATVGARQFIGAAPAAAQETTCDTAGRWWTEQPMPRPTSNAGVASTGGRVYVFGGFDGTTTALAANSEYDPATQTWRDRAKMPTAREALTGAAIDGLVYAIGGSYGGSTQPHIMATVESYDPESDKWTVRPSMPTPRSACRATTMRGLVFVVGGWGGTAPVAHVEAFDPRDNTWHQLRPMPTPRFGHAVAVADGKLFSVAGDDPNGTTSVVEVYDMDEDRWTTGPPMPTARRALAAVGHQGLIYAVGGWNGTNQAATEVFDPRTGEWSQKAPMPTPRRNIYEAVADGAIYVCGGYPESDTNNPTTVVEAFSPL